MLSPLCIPCATSKWGEAIGGLLVTFLCSIKGTGLSPAANDVTLRDPNVEWINHNWDLLSISTNKSRDYSENVGMYIVDHHNYSENPKCINCCC